MARSKKTVVPTTQLTSNTHDIGYILGRVEMLEKKFDEHRLENKEELQEILKKLDQIRDTTSAWRYTMWVIKAIILSLPLIFTWKYEELASLWKSLS